MTRAKRRYLRPACLSALLLRKLIEIRIELEGRSYGGVQKIYNSVVLAKDGAQ